MLFRGKRQFFHEFWALRNVSFQVKRGETVGIIGRNGSGKSTLLQLLCGTLNPTSGDIDINGRVAALLELGAGFNPEFTGRENIHINMSILGVNKATINERLDAVIKFAEIEEFIDQPVKTYSSGMYVRLAFSVAIHVDPDILVIDEALAVGDFAFQFKCLKRLKELSEAGVTILFVTHDILQVQKLCNRALYLKKGQTVFFGDTKTASDLYFSEAAVDEVTQDRTLTPPSSLGHSLHPFQKDMLFNEFKRYVAPYRRGTKQQGELLYVSLNGSFKEEPVIGYGATIELEIVFRLNAGVRNPVIAFYVIDESGQLIVGSNTRYEGLELPSSGDGTQPSRMTVSFENKLRSGRYGVQVYLVDFTPGLQTDYIDYIQLAARFATASPPDGERWAWYTPPFSATVQKF